MSLSPVSLEKMITEYPFLQTESVKLGESKVDFITRRLFEELDFFASLGNKENDGVKIELTNRARNLTRLVKGLPNNRFCFSGAFGIPSTEKLTRYFSGAQEDKDFATTLMLHLVHLNTCAKELLNNQTKKNTLLLEKVSACSTGLISYNLNNTKLDLLRYNVGLCIQLFTNTINERS